MTLNSTHPIVSVIIPVYNTERYLRECLDSVCRQTLRELEIICVNNGSTDASPVILGEYAACDSRIRVFSQKNRDLSAARNRGMEYARGTFIYFLYSDDFIEPTALEKLTIIAEELDLEVIRFESERLYESEELFNQYQKTEAGHVEETSEICTGVEYMEKMRDAKLYLPGVWRSLWRRSLLTENHLAFKEGMLFEDHLFSFQALFKAKRVMHIPDRLHHYRKRENSIMTSSNRLQKAVNFFRSAEDILMSALREDCDPAEEREYYRAFSDMIQTAAFSYALLSAEKRRNVFFPKAIEDVLFKQTVVAGARERKLKLKLEEKTEAADQLFSGSSGRKGRSKTSGKKFVS